MLNKPRIAHIKNLSPQLDLISAPLMAPELFLGARLDNGEENAACFTRNGTW